MGVPVSADGAQESLELTRQLVIAVRGLNRQEFLERGRELRLRRGPAGKRPVVELVDRETGDVVDEFPPEEILRMMTELEKEREGEV
jgi:uncharacterized FlaG/YvyC family protein